MKTTKKRCKAKPASLPKPLPDLLRYYADKFHVWSDAITDCPANAMNYLMSAGASIKVLLERGAFPGIGQRLLPPCDELLRLRYRREAYVRLWVGFVSKQQTGRYSLSKRNRLNTLRNDCSFVADTLEAEARTIKGENKKAHCTHSPDFRKVTWYGKDYNLNKNQAVAMKMLWQAHEDPHKTGIHEQEIGKAVDTFSVRYKLLQTFRQRKKGRRGYHQAWEIIEHVGDGIHKLKVPK